jgi:hypothetical protein
MMFWAHPSLNALAPAAPGSTTRVPAKHRYTPEGSSVILSYFLERFFHRGPGVMGSYMLEPPREWLMRGKSRRVEKMIGPFLFSGPTRPKAQSDAHVPDLYLYSSSDSPKSVGKIKYFRDRGGVRLLVQTEGDGNLPTDEGDVVSALCSHPAKLTKDPYGAWKTEHGIGIGTPAAVVRRRLGKPSFRADYQGYPLDFYLGAPKRYQAGGPGGAWNHQAYDAGFAYSRGKVAEIWIYWWCDEVHH